MIYHKLYIFNKFSVMDQFTRPTFVKISNFSGIILVISLINGYFRTGKIERFVKQV